MVGRLNFDGGTQYLGGGTLTLDGGTLSLDGGTLSLDGGTLSLDGRTRPPCNLSTAKTFLFWSAGVVAARWNLARTECGPLVQKVADSWPTGSTLVRYRMQLMIG